MAPKFSDLFEPSDSQAAVISHQEYREGPWYRGGSGVEFAVRGLAPHWKNPKCSYNGADQNQSSNHERRSGCGAEDNSLRERHHYPPADEKTEVLEGYPWMRLCVSAPCTCLRRVTQSRGPLRD